MSNENTIDAVRLALSLYETQAKIAGANVANANKPGAVALHADFAKVEAALREAASAANETDAAHWLAAASRELAVVRPQASGESIRLDEQVGALAGLGVEYQALTEALSRQFGLMRIAIAGRV